MSKIYRKAMSTEVMWLIGLAPTIVGVALAVDAYLRRASLALALSAPAPVLGDVIGPTAWTQDAAVDVLFGAIALLFGAGTKERWIANAFVVIASVLVCLTLVAIPVGWTSLAIWLISVAGLAALFAAGHYISWLLRSEIDAKWFPIAGWLLIIISAGMAMRSSTASLRKLDRGVLDRSFPGVIQITVDDPESQQRLTAHGEVLALYLIGNDGTHSYFIRIEPEHWRTIAIRSGDIASVQFRRLNVAAAKNRSVFTQPAEVSPPAPPTQRARRPADPTHWVPSGPIR